MGCPVCAVEWQMNIYIKHNFRGTIVFWGDFKYLSEERGNKKPLKIVAQRSQCTLGDPPFEKCLSNPNSPLQKFRK